ncbi:MAG: M12 family metallo-peptidase, partial [Saprospiraceae bacterium]
MKFIPITLLVVLANLLSFYPNHNYYSTTFTQHKEGTPEHPLFKVKQSNLRSNQFAGQLKKGTILQIDSSRLHEIKDAKSFKLELDIPFQNQIIQVELHQVNLFADDFKVRTSDRNDPYPVTPGLFYSGHVKNDPKSLVSFSIFEGEVNGIFSLPELGDIALVKTTSAEDEYMVFSDNDLTGTPDKFECLNQDNDTKLNKIRSQVEQHLEERAAGCISVDFEFDDEIYKDFGSNITTVTNWFTSLFNHIKTIYANEQIEITIKSLYIWTTADPYSSTVGTALDQVMASRQNDPSFTGNLHHLVLGYVSQSVGISGVAYVDVLCSRTYRFGTTRLYQYTTWSTFPSTYQWDIGSIAHEIGHNFGSHHTQWCGWTGGPIDNCYAVEGTCSPGPAPVNGGTIMSYCHLNTNYPMSNGFGPLPHTEIYNNFVAATCKSTSCSGIVTPTPTCSDGIQNGDETGVDCGGSCVACGGGGGGGCTVPSNISIGKTVLQSSNYNSSNSYP